MKKIVIYECSDGKRFDRKLDAEVYESILGTVGNIISMLGPEPKSCNAVKHKKEIVETALTKLMDLCGDTISSYKDTFKHTTINNINNLSGRVLSDYSGKFPCLHNAYYRFMCINPTSFIEYDQPYWVTHEEEFEKFRKEHI